MKTNVIAIVAVAIVCFGIGVRIYEFRQELAERLSSQEARIVALNDSISVLRLRMDTLTATSAGLGEFMLSNQMHVAKIWFEANAGNWPLAGYETDELDETMEGAEALHAVRNNVNISGVLDGVRTTQVAELRGAIKKTDKAAFLKSYNDLLATCNACHQSAGYAFIHLKPPTTEPVSNQVWGVAK
jgi:hypothetical protein